MESHLVRVFPSSANFPMQEQLAWKIAAFAATPRSHDELAMNMALCRIVDNAAVAVASLSRGPVVTARQQALCHPRADGATLFGLTADLTVQAEWAAWANATAVRELDFHDTFLAADYAHPGDNISPLIAVAQQCGRNGADLLHAILVAYEVHVALVKAISLHRYKKDHVAHLTPATVAGLGALLQLPTETVYHAVNQAVHLAFSTRQSRKGEISSWKAFAPGFSGKMAIEAVDRAMRGEASPNPIYEGEDSVITWMLGGPKSKYVVELPAANESAIGILETYTKAHSAEYQAQALIDLAIDVGARIDLQQVREIVLHTSHHTHFVIGSGANDPQKSDPDASRETLDHSISYILAVALEDRRWHYVDSYPPARRVGPSTRSLWRKIRTVEDEVWTRRYNNADPGCRAFGGRLEIFMQDGGRHVAEKMVADAHPNGTKPWSWPDYVKKFDALALEPCGQGERDRFLSLVESLADTDARALMGLMPKVDNHGELMAQPVAKGIFDFVY